MIQAFPFAPIWFFQTWGLIGPCTAPGLCFLCKYSLQNFNKSALVCHTGRLMTNHIIFPLIELPTITAELSPNTALFLSSRERAPARAGTCQATLSSIIWGKCPFLPSFFPPPSIHDKILELILPRGFMQSHERTSKGYLNTKGRKGGAPTWKNSPSCSWDAEAAPKLGQLVKLGLFVVPGDQVCTMLGV